MNGIPSGQETDLRDEPLHLSLPCPLIGRERDRRKQEGYSLSRKSRKPIDPVGGVRENLRE
jgi:hypothetical protein